MNILSKIVYAQELVTNAATLVQRINKFIINPLIVFIFALALVYFLWGMVEFIAGANNEEKRAIGRRHMIWGLVGMLIMIGVFTIMKIIVVTLGAKLSPEELGGGQVDIEQ
ncbi:MAG TPA: hypothetical protein VJ103_01535 [Candidatus Paceibacterota bacterium]|nr:hypothetical protein [Candidatus Paceibacterota bacterium]